MTYDDKAFTVFAFLIVAAYFLALWRLVKARLSRPKPTSMADDLLAAVEPYRPENCRWEVEPVEWVEALGTEKVRTLQKVYGAGWAEYANERIWVPKHQKMRLKPLKLRTDLNNGRAGA